MNQTEINKLVKKAFIHKPTKNKTYYKSWNSDKILKIITHLRDNENWTDARIKSLFPRKKSSEIDDLKMLGVLVESNILKINNKSIATLDKSVIRSEIFENWTNYSKIFEKYSISKSQIKSSDLVLFDASQLFIYKEQDL